MCQLMLRLSQSASNWVLAKRSAALARIHDMKSARRSFRILAKVIFFLQK